MRLLLLNVWMLMLFMSYARIGVGQNIDQTKISVQFTNTSVKKALQVVSKLAKINIAYKDQTINNRNISTKSYKKESVADILKDILTPFELTYIERNKNIIIVPQRKTMQESVIPISNRLLLHNRWGDSIIDVRGTVLNDRDDPIAGATIQVVRILNMNLQQFTRLKAANLQQLIGNEKGLQTNSDLTNGNGDFNFQLPPGNYIFIVSYVGFTTQYVKRILRKDSPPGFNSFKIILKSKDDIMENVVVSTGIFQKADNTFTGSSTTVTTDELLKFGNRNLITSLRNIDPAFNIIDNNSFGSNPNQIPEIQIRGNASVPNVNELQDETRVALNTPLIILDGFETTLGKLLDINPADVATLTILKDASATAIYGSRGANGVVVITTRPPRPGKLRVNYRGDLTFETPDLTTYDLLDAREKLDLEYKTGYYDEVRADNDVALKRYYNFILQDVNRGVNTDWLSIPLRNAVGQKHSIRLEGGDQTFRYSLTTQYNDIEGVMKGSARKTFNGTVSLMYTRKNLKISNNLMLTEQKSTNSPYGSFSDYVKLNPYWKPYDSLGNVIKTFGDPGNGDYYYRWTTLPTNPLYNATLPDFNKANSSQINNNTIIEFRVFDDLTIKARLGISKSVNETDIFRSADNTAFANYSNEDIFRKGDYNYGITKGFSYDGSLNLSYSKVFAQKHSLFAGADYNIRNTQGSTYGFKAEGFSNPKFDFISMGLQYAKDGKPTGSEDLSRAVGITSNVNYGYDNKYFVDGSFRLDGASQFGSNKRFAPFWSAGLGWNLKDEHFLANSKIINRLKLRSSVGISGTQNFDSYQALSTYNYYTNDRYFTWNGSYLMALGNDDLRWQQTKQLNIGLDGEFLGSRIKVRADVYHKKTRDLISAVNIPASNGFSSYIANVGSIQNKGIEAQVTFIVINDYKREIMWSVTASGVRNSNKILSISQALRDAQQALLSSTNLYQLYYEGYSSNTIWVVPSLGIDPSTGREIYKSKNGLPTFDWSGENVADFGNTDPKLFGNINTSFRYKNISANISFGYRFGGQQYNQTLVTRVESGNYDYNVDQRVYNDRWEKPGDMAAFKGLLITTPTYKTSRFVQDENTLECQNINIQYDIRNKVFNKRTGLEILSFSANMAEPFYISSIMRERGTNYPFSRQFSFSINATF